jgi:hypothetical protein
LPMSASGLGCPRRWSDASMAISRRSGTRTKRDDPNSYGLQPPAKARFSADCSWTKGRVQFSGGGGRRFESSRSDQVF